jgi:hypothetical protein
MKNEVYKGWKKRPSLCGFAIICRGQDNRVPEISNHIVYEFVFQWGYWVYEFMIYEPISPNEKVQRIGLFRWFSAMFGAVIS